MEPLPLTVIGTMLGVPRADHVQAESLGQRVRRHRRPRPHAEGLERAIRALEAFATMWGSSPRTSANLEESGRGTGDRRGGRKSAVAR